MTSKKDNLALIENPPEVNRVINQSIEEEMKQSYLDYAMSVIVARALPDVRDGLKPVHRRILYAMWDIGLKPNAKFRKSATVVGEVLGKYHPHGDAAVYDSLVRLAQPFAMRQVLVKGQGNFGSIDGDSAAAMRYTETKLAQISEELLTDIEKDTVNFLPNYDGSHQEPQVLPARLPNLLLNGTMGIAVGMATSIPPHNLGELIEAIQYLISDPEATVDDLMKFVQGPDFPTAGAIFNKEDIKQAYATGKGSVVMRAKAEIEEFKGGFAIIVTELPYQVNKAELVMKIAELVKEKKIEGIKDLRDESDKDGIRVVIELKKDAYPKKVLNQLYKHTALQTSFHFNMLALVDGLQPRVLTLKSILEEYLKHRQEVVKRRAEFDLKKAEDRAHILEGLVMALEDIDKIITTIKKSKDKEDAKKNLIARFKLSDRQAEAILEMKLQQLANLEKLRLEEELKDKRKLIKELKELLANQKKILGVIKEELIHIKDKYATNRLTKVYAGAVDKFTQEDLIPNEATVVIITKDGYLKRLAPDTFKAQGRGGKGVIGLTAKEEDSVEQLFSTTTHADLLFFTSRGRVFELKAYDVPQGSRTSKGQAVVNFLQLSPEEKVSEVLSLTEWEGYKYLIMVTKQGVIKKVTIDAFSNVRRSGLIAINLKNGDSLLWVKPSTSEDDVIMVTAKGQSIRFKEKGVRPMGRTAAGVRAIRLKSGDEVTGVDLINEGRPGPDEQLLVVMAHGYGKRTKLREYKVQGRGGSGIKTANITTKTGQIVYALVVNAKREQEDLIVMSDNGQVIRLALKAVSVLGRATQGVRIMRFKAEKDQVASVTFV
ncbi:DNA gyrase subunit A [Patescibacteria group bacterium]|nr:DNA gyrase subunit A [Patescibacteria group bacterium]